MNVLNEICQAPAMAGSMTWEILWPLIMGFTLSGIVQAVVRKEQLTRLLSSDSPRALAAATGLGVALSAASSQDW
ncbi:UNVERIFIED_ORG: uncharacterized membrane protein YraQ (UPF0718 family) [Arthrobacter sp. UYCu721]